MRLNDSIDYRFSESRLDKMRDMDSCHGVLLVTKWHELGDHEICVYNLKSASR